MWNRGRKYPRETLLRRRRNVSARIDTMMRSFDHDTQGTASRSFVRHKSSSSKDENADGDNNTNPTSDIEKEQKFHHIYNIPNALTMTRVVLAGPLAYALFVGEYKIAFAGIVFGGVCDWLDGFLARRWNQQTVLGSFLDPAADKLMVAAIVAPMAMTGLLSPWIVGIVIGRDALLLGGGFVYRWWTRPPGVPFFNTTYGASFEVKPTLLSKMNTAAQLGLCGYAVTAAAFDSFPAEFTPFLEYATGALTVSSGMQYAFMFMSPSQTSAYSRVDRTDADSSKSAGRNESRKKDEGRAR